MFSLIALLISGCANESVVVNNDDVITFSTAVGKQTRATEVVIEDLQEACQSEPLRVHARYTDTGAEFFHPVFDLTYSGSYWYYGDVIRYPLGRNLTYYSTFPEQEIDFSLNPLNPYFEYTVVGGVDDGEDGDGGGEEEEDNKQIDLIATRTDAGDGAVTLKFDHVLSQINFAVKGAAGYTVTINSDIFINYIHNSGKYYFADPAQGQPAYWEDVDGIASYKYDVPDLGSMSFTTEDIISLATANNALMLMPQYMDGTNEMNTITFDYTISEDGISENKYTGPAKIFLSGMTWEPGHSYLIVLDFSGPYITFEQVDLGPWQDEDVYVIPNPDDYIAHP